MTNAIPIKQHESHSRAPIVDVASTRMLTRTMCIRTVAAVWNESPRRELDFSDADAIGSLSTYPSEICVLSVFRRGRQKTAGTAMRSFPACFRTTAHHSMRPSCWEGYFTRAFGVGLRDSPGPERDSTVALEMVRIGATC